MIRKHRSNSASSIISSLNIKEPRRHSTGQKGGHTSDEQSAMQNHNRDHYNEDANSSIPNVDLTLSVDRRRQSIEGSLIMAEKYNNHSASLSVNGNGIGSTGDNEYDSGNFLSTF